LLWCLVVLADVNQNLQFTTAALCIPRGSSVLLRHGDQYHYARVSHGQAACVVVMCIIRLAIAAVLGVIGLEWLSRTTSIGELILNGVALEFVFSIDERVFDACTGFRVKHIVGNMVPLRRPNLLTRSFKGFSAGPVLVMTLACAGAVAAFATWGLTTFKLLSDITHELCHGNKDFVVGIHKSTGWPVSASTPELRNPVDLYASAVREGVDFSLAQSTFGDYSSRMFDAETWLGASIAESLRFHFLHTGCVDDEGVAEDKISTQWHTLRHVSKIGNARACIDLRTACDSKDVPLVRLTCPVTCGCRHPLSGLVWGAREHGCPREECIESSQYQTALGNMTCKDASLESLRSGRFAEAWAKYWSNMFRSLEVWQSYKKFDDLEALKEEATNTGCAFLAKQSFRQLCSDRSGYASLAAFCPETCRCGQIGHYSRYCPTSCLLQ